MARATKLNEALQDQICDDIRLGDTYVNAATRAGISERVLHLWREKGRKAQTGQYFQFLQAVRKAEAEALRTAALHVRNAMSNQWQAAAWFLERRDPANYSRRTEVSGPAGAPIKTEAKGHSVIRMDPAEMKEVLLALDDAGVLRGPATPGDPSP